MEKSTPKIVDKKHIAPLPYTSIFRSGKSCHDIWNVLSLGKLYPVIAKSINTECVLVSEIILFNNGFHLSWSYYITKVMNWCHTSNIKM